MHVPGHSLFRRRDSHFDADSAPARSMDNVPSHHAVKTTAYLKHNSENNASAAVFQPPKSPDLNPHDQPDRQSDHKEASSENISSPSTSHHSSIKSLSCHHISQLGTISSIYCIHLANQAPNQAIRHQCNISQFINRHSSSP